MISASLGCMLCIQIRKGTWERSVAHGNRCASAKKAQARQGPVPRQRKGPPWMPGRDQVCGIFRLKPAAAALRAGLQFYILSYAATIMRLSWQWQRIVAPQGPLASKILRIGATPVTPGGISLGARPYPGGRCNSPCTPPRTAASRRASRRSGSSGCSSSLRASGASSLRRQPRGTSWERISHSVLRTWK